jgi:hypothetical protein
MPCLELLEAPHLLAKRRELLFEARRLRGERVRGLLPVGGVELAQIAGNALFELRPAPLHLRPRQVAIPIIDRLELAAVDGNAGCRKQTQLTAELDEPGAHLADGAAIVLPEIGDRLVVRDEATKQPRHLDVAAGLAFEPPARLHPVEIAVDVELQECRRMIARPPHLRRRDAVEPEFGAMKPIDKGVDRPNRIVRVDPVVQAVWKQRALPAIRPLDKPSHPIPRNVTDESYRTPHAKADVFTQPGSFSSPRARNSAVRFTSGSGCS